MADSPIEVRRAEALRDVVRAQRQVANALDALKSSDADERSAAMIALEHAHVKLGGALADFYSAAEVTQPEADDSEPDELYLRRLHAAVEALEEHIELDAPGPTPEPVGAQADEAGRVPEAGRTAEELASLITQCAREVEGVRSVLAESAAHGLERRLASARLGGVEDRLTAIELRLRLLEEHLVESGTALRPG